MMRTLMTFVCAIVFVASHDYAVAQVGSVGTCAELNNPPIAIVPPHPAPGQPVTITVSTYAASGQSASAHRVAGEGDVIVVTLAVNQIYFGTPPQFPICGSVNVGALGAGSYTVSFMLDTNNTGPVLQGSTTFQVVEASPSSTSIPTMSTLGLLLLTLLIPLVTRRLWRSG